MRNILLYGIFLILGAALMMMLAEFRKNVAIPVVSTKGTELEKLLDEREFSDTSWRSFSREYPDCVAYGYYVTRLGLFSRFPATSRRFIVLLERSEACGNP